MMASDLQTTQTNGSLVHPLISLFGDVIITKKGEVDTVQVHCDLNTNTTLFENYVRLN